MEITATKIFALASFITCMPCTWRTRFSVLSRSCSPLGCIEDPEKKVLFPCMCSCFRTRSCRSFCCTRMLAVSSWHFVGVRGKLDVELRALTWWMT